MTLATRYRKRIATSLLALFALWQVSALIHFATVPHTLCPHGQIIDARDHGDHGGHHHHGHHGHHGHGKHEGHDDCDTVAAITVARTMAGAQIEIPILSELLEIEVIPEWEQSECSQQEVLMLSPSNSPPSSDA